jgi:hypothetical protein
VVEMGKEYSLNGRKVKFMQDVGEKERRSETTMKAYV